MAKKVLLAILVTLMLQTTVFAQDLNEDVPACTDDQVMAILVAVNESEVVAEALAISNRIAEAGITEMVDIAADLDAYQVKWWSEVTPEFPVCTYALEMEATVGRYLDEMLFSTLMTHVAYSAAQSGSSTTATLYTEIAGRHLEAFVELGIQVSALASVAE